jgi:DNA-binding response OmpR family regulator
MAKILVVEDDLVTASMVREFLEHERYTVEEAHTAEQASEFLKTYEYDIVILDWQLPDASGIDVLKKYRDGGGSSPVIMLTGKKEVNEKEVGLDSGADDYLTKPFNVRELSARVRALLRRSPAVQGNVMQCAYLTLDTTTATVAKEGQKLKLLPTEYALLEFLMRNQGRVYNTDALLQHVWKADSEATDNGVRTYITRLRQKIDKDGVPSLIKTLHGLGYKLESDETPAR